VLAIFLIIPGTSADDANAPQKMEGEQLTPPGTFPELPSPPNYKREPPPAPTIPENKGAINPMTGDYYPPSGKGAINPRTGEYYPPSGQGFINPRTGAYYPHSRP